MAMDREYHRNYSRQYYHDRKAQLIERLGGECAWCGDTRDLTSDHLDPNEKSFSIGKLLNFSKKVVDEEIKKCQLLCNNCHIFKTYLNNDNGARVLSTEQVFEIRTFYFSGQYTQRLLAEKFGVHQTTISGIINNLNHVRF